MKCGKEIKPKITQNDNEINSELTYNTLRGGLGNKELGKLCEECYEILKNNIMDIRANILKSI
jgi:hypothetical protein